MIGNSFNQIPPPKPKGKDAHTQLISFANDTHGKPKEQLFPNKVVIQLP